MSSAHDLGPVPTRLTIGADLVRRLVTEQFPQWSDLPVRAVTDGGWDNSTFHLGPDMSVRLPTAAEYALAVDEEHHWLPRLAARLPLPIPTPLGKGAPGAGYPFAWSIHRWLEGTPVTATSTTDGTTDPVRFALDLADFLTALRRVDPTDGPPPGVHNWFRGGTLRTYDATTHRALSVLDARPDSAIDLDLARQVWATALAARWDRVPVWFHGDIAAGNLLLRDRRLAAVIDFGTCGVGDPACDLAGAWTLLDTDGRDAFRDRLGADEATWARGRGWALWKTLSTCAQTVDQNGDQDDEAATTARRILEAIFEEYRNDRDRRR